MKCPNCGKWNQASLPHCVYCGQELPNDAYGPQGVPAWQLELEDRDRKNSYVRIDESGQEETTSDPRDTLASEMADLKSRKLMGEQKQRMLREEAARRGMAPSGRSVRTTSNRGTFFSAYDDPDTALRPVAPELVEEGEVAPDAKRVVPVKYRTTYAPSQPEDEVYGYGNTRRIVNIQHPDESETVYDGYHDTSAYLPSFANQDEYENSMRLKNAALSRKPRRHSGRRILRFLVLLGMLGQNASAQSQEAAADASLQTLSLLETFLGRVPSVVHEVSMALAPLLAMFIVFQLFLIFSPDGLCLLSPGRGRLFRLPLLLLVRRQMHVIRHFLPGHKISRAVGTENGSGRIFFIPVRFIPDPRKDFLLAAAHIITPEGTGQVSSSSGVGSCFPCIVPHGRHRRPALKDRHFLLLHRGLTFAAHVLDICQRTARHFHRNLQIKFIIRFQKDAVRLHQSLADSPVSGLPEVSALGMFQMRFSCRQRDLHICNGGPGQHATVDLLSQMGQDQPLPVQA